MTEPTVSALIVVRDGERHLAEAIESTLAQTHPPSEVIVVDNGSTDASAEIARDFGPPVSVHAEPRLGIGFARNACLRHLSGEYAGFLDSDDTWEPAKTELQLAAFAEDPLLDLVFGHVRQFVSPELDPATAARLRLPDAPQPGLFLGSMLAPRSVWSRVGDWDAAWGTADGLAWLVKARDIGLREKMLAETVANRRIHGANQSFGDHNQRSEWARLLKGSLDRRRAGGA